VASPRHGIEEHDVVALRECVADWPPGTEGTVVSIYENAALVEVAEDVRPGRRSTTF
jgi:hypothetical protein